MASTVQHSTLTGTENHEPKGADTATAGTVYVSDGAGSGSWTTLAGTQVSITDTGGYYTGTTVEAILQEIRAFPPQFGGLYITNNVTAETATGSAVDWTTNWVSGSVQGGASLDTSTGGITVDATGTYQLVASLSVYQSGASAADWLINVEVNGVAVAKTDVRYSTSATDLVPITLTGFLELTAADEVTIAITRLSGAVNPIVNYANFTITRVL